MLRYGVSTSEWIRRVGKRMKKFDYQAYSHEEGFRVEIGEGDEDWPEIRAAMKEVGYYGGWVTAEVRGGGRERLREISTLTNTHVLGL